MHSHSMKFECLEYSIREISDLFLHKKENDFFSELYRILNGKSDLIGITWKAFLNGSKEFLFNSNTSSVRKKKTV